MESQLRMTGLPRCIASAAVVLTLGCAAAPEAAEPELTASVADASATARCPEDTPAFSVGPESGLLVAGNRSTVQARIVQADPAQPTRFENDWTVQFSDPNGMVLDDLVIANACAFMPVHGHGGVPKEVIKTGAGTYSFVGLNLFMRGPWEVQLAVSSSAAVGAANSEATNCDRDRRQTGSDMVIFRACISDD